MLRRLIQPADRPHAELRRREQILTRCPVAFNRATAWFKLALIRRTSPAASISSTNASRIGTPAPLAPPRDGQGRLRCVGAPRQPGQASSDF